MFTHYGNCWLGALAIVIWALKRRKRITRVVILFREIPHIAIEVEHKLYHFTWAYESRKGTLLWFEGEIKRLRLVGQSWTAKRRDFGILSVYPKVKA